jgi:hypothetical protein
LNPHIVEQIKKSNYSWRISLYLNLQIFEQYEKSNILLKNLDGRELTNSQTVRKIEHFAENRDILEQNEEKNILLTNFTGLE